jgi:hypothetical protein
VTSIVHGTTYQETNLLILGAISTCFTQQERAQHLGNDSTLSETLSPISRAMMETTPATGFIDSRMVGAGAEQQVEARPETFAGGRINGVYARRAPSNRNPIADAWTGIAPPWEQRTLAMLFGILCPHHGTVRIQVLP